MSSKYVNPTGDGYLGIVASYDLDGRPSLTLSRSYLEDIGVDPGVDVAVLVGDDRVELLPPDRTDRDPDGVLKTLPPGGTSRRKSGTLGLKRYVDELGVGVSEDVRIYRREDPERLVLVARKDDPFLEEGSA